MSSFEFVGGGRGSGRSTKLAEAIVFHLGESELPALFIGRDASWSHTVELVLNGLPDVEYLTATQVQEGKMYGQRYCVICLDNISMLSDRLATTVWRQLEIHNNAHGTPIFYTN